VAQHLDAFYLSLDEINEARGLFGGEGISVEEWEKTHYLAMEQLENFMPSEQDIVLDDTNCFRWLRDRFRNLGVRYGYQTTLIFLDIPLAEIDQRIAANEQNQTINKVKQEIIEKMQKTFESPQVDEKSIKYSGEKSIKQWMIQHFNS
jgi:predicted kinase